MDLIAGYKRMIQVAYLCLI